MDITIRHATADDWTAIGELDGANFGELYAEQTFQDMTSLLDVDRILLAVSGERVVGMAADYPFEMTVPGGQLAIPGVTWVSVDATHRRHGVLRRLMTHQLSGFRTAGFPAAALMASQGGIYGRFGYGVATQLRKTSIDRRRLRLREPGDPTAVTRVNAAEARTVMPALHERWREQTPGAFSRSERWWDFLTLDRDWQRGGMSGLFYLLHRDGYVAYRIKDEWDDGDPRQVCFLTDYVITSPQAHADLWQVLLGLDLVATIESLRIQFDDPLPWRVDDSRQIRTTRVGDGLWLRPLDVGALLAGRRYALDVDVRLDLRDELFGTSRVRLRGGADGAECGATDQPAQLSLDVAQLGAAYLDGVRLETLARAGLVDVADEAALVRLDRALLGDRLPQHGLGF